MTTRFPVRGLSLAIAIGAICLPLRAQNATPPSGNSNPNPAANSTDNRGRRGNFNPEQMMAALRDRMGVTDDAEWALISARITAVAELRRTAGGGGFRGGGGRGGNPEMDALRTAITDNLPDAEVKARLERFREVRKQNEAKLDKAREELRAVLTVRQEAIAVMFGLLL